MLASQDLSVNNLGGSVSQGGLSMYRLCGGPYPQPSRCLAASMLAAREPHAAPSHPKRGLSQLHFSWPNAASRYVNQIPSTRGDVSSFNRVQVRAGFDFSSLNNRASTQDFSLVLVDASGRQASVPASVYTKSLFLPPGRYSEVPRVTLNTVRIPLSAFQGVDLRNIRTVRFDFNKQVTGTLMFSDLMFAR
jgi:hypothetical protein